MEAVYKQDTSRDSTWRGTIDKFDRAEAFGRVHVLHSLERRRAAVADGSQNGLQAEYFSGVDLKQSAGARTDWKIDFTWGNGLSPFAQSKPAETALMIELPVGRYCAEWVDTKSGAIAKREEFKHDGGVRKLTAPNYKGDIVLQIKPNR
jgi:hypothetical protein